MRILISRTSDGTVGGAELSARDHALTLSKLGHIVAFATNLKVLKNKLGREGIPTNSIFWIHAGFLRPLLFPVLFLANLMLALIICVRVRPSIVNSHSRDDQIIFTLLKPLFGYTAVWKDAGDMHFMLRTSRRNPIAKAYQRLYCYCMKKCDGIYFLNAANEAEAVSFVPQLKGKTRVIKTDVMFDELQIEPKEKHDKLIVGTVIRLADNKGVDLLISAFADVLKQYPDTELWIVGDGVLRPALERQTGRLGIGSSVRFAGFQENPSYWLSNFDIFVQPALIEAWGRNVKEAKYFGLPIIGSATDGIKTQIVDGITGLLFPPGDVKALEEKLSILLGDKDMRKRIGNAAKRAALSEGDFHKLMRDEILPFLKGAK